MSRMTNSGFVGFLSIFALLIAPPLWGDDAEIRVNKGSGPALNTDFEVGTGDVLYSEYERSEYEFAKLKSDIRVSQSGKFLPKGLVLAAQPKVISQRKEYCRGFETALYCLEDSDKDGSFDKVRIGGGGRALPNVSGGYVLEYEPVDDLPGWRKDLLYQGASGGVARFSFHEYGTDWTTPKVTKELSYDLSPEGSTEIVYQGAKIQIESATSNSVRYKVLQGFRPPGPERR